MNQPFGNPPARWKLARVDRVANVNARIGWKSLTADEYKEDGYAFLSTPNIKNEEIDFDNVNYISAFRYEESPELKLAVGDVLLAKDGSTLGISNLVRDLPRAATVNGSIAVIRPFAIFPGFLRYALASSPSQDRINAIKGGMGVPHLFQWDIKRLPIILPALPLQQEIARLLDVETARIDALIYKKKTLIELLESRSASLISSAVGIEVRRTADGIPIVGGRHPIARLGAVSVVQSGLTLDAGRELDASAITRPYLRVANVQDGRVDLAEVKEVRVPLAAALRCELKVGDVLMTEGGDPDKLGRGAVWHREVERCLHQNHVFAVRPSDALLPEFLALVTRTAYARAYFEATASKTTGIASTSTSKIASFRIPLPTVGEQHAIIAETSHRLAKIADLVECITRQVNLLRERRRTLITAGVTGELDIEQRRPG